MNNDLRVTVWNEYWQEKTDSRVAEIYPDGIHVTLAAALSKKGLQVRTATLDEPEQGLTNAVLDATDVLVWWGHKAHNEVADAVVERVQRRVLNGMGLIVLHSGHFSKLFMRLMGTSCNLKWRESGDYERLWVVAPEHPIAVGLDEYVEIEHEETYGEPFEVPPPETLVFVSWFSGGEVFRSGCCYTRGLGKVFYFRPGHETLPTYHLPNVQHIIANAVRWAAPTLGVERTFGSMAQPNQKGNS